MVLVLPFARAPAICPQASKGAWRLYPRTATRRSSSATGESSSGKKRQSYIDEWHAATVKPIRFYEEQAAPGRKRKCYFYSVDLQGRVFLEEVLPKNIATSLKSPKFLDFFFRHLRRVGPRERSHLDTIGAGGDYPFVSPCGIEWNFVRPADAAIVFHDMREWAAGGGAGDRDGPSGRKLVFGATLAQPFSPERLLISQRTGRMYHILTEVDENNATANEMCERSGSAERRVGRSKPLTPLHAPDGREEYGLIKSSLAVTLSDGIVEGDMTTDEKKLSSLGCKEYSGMDFMCFETGNKRPIAWLPDDAEPGPWGLPFDEGNEPVV